MKTLLRIMIVLGIIILLVFGLGYYILNLPQFGKSPSGMHLEKIEQSPQHDGKVFRNEGNVELSMGPSKILDLIKAYANQPDNRKPKSLLPMEFRKVSDFNLADTITHLTWFGHSAFLLEIDQKTILLDPMLGPAAAPFEFQIQRFRKELPIGLDSIPPIDAIVFSHDHYDHLDYSTIKALNDRVGHYFVPLGLRAHLEHWGVDPSKITELDWWEEIEFDGIKLACTPSQHFSGRGISDRAKTLWCSWVIQGKKKNIYFSGDSGYFKGFKEIGKKYGPFDFAMIECGQYNELWKDIHMMPEESAQAAVDLNANKMMPIHWGMFELALHTWTDPVKRVTVAAKNLGIPIITPIIGKRFTIEEEIGIDGWWKTN